MEQYIGTKIIEAEPAYRVDGKTVQPTTWPVEKDAKVEEGYAVRYQDGYMSWSPKAVFEEAYKPVHGMSFGLALDAMRKGFKVRRRGWNGKGMFIYIQEGSTLQPGEGRNRVLREMGGTISINAHIDMKAADDSIVVGWLASQTDMLAGDWEFA